MARHPVPTQHGVRDRRPNRVTDWNISSSDSVSVSSSQNSLSLPMTDLMLSHPPLDTSSSGNSSNTTVSRPRPDLDAGTLMWSKLLTKSNNVTKDFGNNSKTGAIPTQNTQAAPTPKTAKTMVTTKNSLPVVNKSRAVAPAKAPKKTSPAFKAMKSFPLNELPTELLIAITVELLVYNGPLVVSPTFHPLPRGSKSPLNYSILHAAKFFYEEGLPCYYMLNTFAIELADFRDIPDTTNAWAELYHGAADDVMTVRVTARMWQNFDDSFALLRGFKALKEITFDLRHSNLQYGVLEGDPKEEKKFFEARRRVSETVMDALLAGGVAMKTVASVWVVEDANILGYNEEFLVEKLLKGLGTVQTA